MKQLINANNANSVNLPLVDRIKRDALKYERYKDQLDRIPKGEIGVFMIEVAEAYDRLTINPEIPPDNFSDDRIINGLDIVFCEGNPYTDLAELTRGIKKDGILFVSTDNNDSALLPGVLNLQFRAVHDYLHYLYQQPFDFAGEFNVYKAQRLLHSTKLGRKILYSEIVLQAAYCTYFGKFSELQKVIVY